MTVIRAACPRCGEVELTNRDFTLRVCGHAPLSYYAFECPECHDQVRKPADDHVISLLMSGGVRAQIWDVPAEVVEPKIGPPIGYDDLLDFVCELRRRDLLAELLDQLIRSSRHAERCRSSVLRLPGRRTVAACRRHGDRAVSPM